jgi:hypothetical protein
MSARVKKRGRGLPHSKTLPRLPKSPAIPKRDAWIPDPFKQGMYDAEAGNFANMEEVLSGAKPPARRTY